MKKALSYLWPFTRKIKSKFSGELEVTWIDGKKVLDTKNANYSYGALHQVMDWALSTTNADRGGETLILGLGGGSVLQLLREKYNFYGKLNAVELDPVIIEIAKTEFNIEKYQPLEIVEANAINFVKETSKKFDTIIVDLFIDNKVPEEFFKIDFWKNIKQLLTNKSTIIFNAGIEEEQSALIEKFQQEIQPLIAFEKHSNVLGVNTVVVRK